MGYYIINKFKTSGLHHFKRVENNPYIVHPHKIIVSEDDYKFEVENNKGSIIKLPEKKIIPNKSVKNSWSGSTFYRNEW
jgi:hypothetical protein